MMKDNKALIVGVLIVLVALVAVNLDKTGNVVKDTQVSVSPTLVESGEYVNIALSPGVRGIDCKISIYNEKGLRRRTITRYCDSTFREHTVVPMKTDANWEGLFYVGVTDEATGEEVTAAFEVI